NLQRLQDIVDEVDKQLRSVKLQAAKAQRYQEYSDRLKELRLGLGLQEFEQLTGRLESEGQALAASHTGVADQAGHVDVLAAGMRRLEESLAQLDEQLHKEEAELAQTRQQLATHDAPR